MPGSKPVQGDSPLSLKNIQTIKAETFASKEQPDRGGWFVEMTDTSDREAALKAAAATAPRGIGIGKNGESGRFSSKRVGVKS